jgi:hypothetical protein
MSAHQIEAVKSARHKDIDHSHPEILKCAAACIQSGGE